MYDIGDVLLVGDSVLTENRHDVVGHVVDKAVGLRGRHDPAYEIADFGFDTIRQDWCEQIVLSAQLL